MLKNTYKKAKADEIEHQTKKRSLMNRFKISKRFQVALGILLQGIACFLTIAFISHLIHGHFDQATLETIQESGFLSARRSMHNWLGILGAIISYYFIFRWLGIAALLIVPPLYILGAKLTESRLWHNWHLGRSFTFSIFFIFWLNIAIGYLALRFPTLSFLERLMGGVALELGIRFYDLLSWGTFIFLFTTLLMFIVIYFNATALPNLLIVYFQKFFHQDKSKEATNETTVGTSINHQSASLAQSGVQQLYEDQEIDMEDSATMPIAIDNSKADINEPAAAVLIGKKNIAFDIVDTEQEETTTDSSSNEKLATKEAIAMEKDPNTTPVNMGKVVDAPLADYDPKLELPNYQYPTVDLLEERETPKKEINQEELAQNKDKIIKTLTDFKIGIASIKATIGPTVTLYEIIPEAGIKISKIKNLEDDIALSLAALGIRIIAPIPGKGTIGIEVPNKSRVMVPFRDMLCSDKFIKSGMDLPLILGKSIANEAVIVDLSRMPHLLIAGATGQGKSVGLNVLLASLIYKKHPSQLKLVLVDPKKVELSLFSHLERHFLAKLPDSEEPIITETKKVVHTLNSLCIEMDLRYDLLKQAGARNIKEYNDKFIKRRLNPENGHRFLPYIVLIIDEFADMMMTAGKEVEMPIARLAQLARAIGIHLVLATQRPSVNVITGIIKANFPVRISFRVTSKIDSRTILDTGGADQLVGQGDMLLAMNSAITRLQCPFLDTHEIENICDFIGNQQGYSSAYMLPEYEESDEGAKLEIETGEMDPLFEEAARLIVAHQQGSTSLIQRKLKLGYNRAGRLIDQLEAAGIVGPFEGSKARDVLIQDERSLEMLLNNRYEQHV